MAEKSILSQLHPRSSLDNGSLEITIIEPYVRGLQSIPSNSHSRHHHHHHHHHHKRIEQKKWEVREDLQRKMKEVKQKISELEAQGSGCHSFPKRQYDYPRRNAAIGKASVSSKMLTRSVSEGALQRRKNAIDSQKLYTSRKSGICKVCNLSLSQQEELLRFVSAQHQQVLRVMHEIKAELKLLKNDKLLERIYKRKAESLTVFPSNRAVVKEPLPTIQQMVWERKDTDFGEHAAQIGGVIETEEAGKDFNACAPQPTEIPETENAVTIAPTPEEQLEKELPTVETKKMQAKENVECIENASFETNPMKQSACEYNTDSDANSSSCVKPRRVQTKLLSHEASVKCNAPQTGIVKGTRTPVPQRKLYSKSFNPEITSKVKDFPQKETLAPINRSNTAKQSDESTTARQKTAGSAYSVSRTYGNKYDSHIRQTKPLKLLKTCRPKQKQHKDGVAVDKYDISNLSGTKEDLNIDSKTTSGNISTISGSPKVDNIENETHHSPTRSTDAISNICSKSFSDSNWMTEMNLDGEKEVQLRYQDSSTCSSTATELEIAEITSKNQTRKHKLGKLLRTKKAALFGKSDMSPESKKPPILNRESPSSLTFVIEKSKSKISIINQKDKDTPECTDIAAPENDIPCRYFITDSKKAPTDAICTSHYVHFMSYTTPSVSFRGTCNMHAVPDIEVFRDAETVSSGRSLGRVLTKKSINPEKTLSEQSHSSLGKVTSTKVFYNSKEKENGESKLEEMHLRNDAPALEHPWEASHHTLVFWNGENLTTGQEARRQMDALLSTCLHQDKKENLRKMFAVQDNVSPELPTSEGRTSAAAWKYDAAENETSRDVPSARNCMQESYLNPNFDFIPTSEASINPRYVDTAVQDKLVPHPSTKLDYDMQEIELSLSFDDLEYLLLHKIKKQEMKRDTAQVEALRKTLNAVRQCFMSQQQESCEALESPKQTLSRIRTVILSPRNFVAS